MSKRSRSKRSSEFLVNIFEWLSRWHVRFSKPKRFSSELLAVFRDFEHYQVQNLSFFVEGITRINKDFFNWVAPIWSLYTLVFNWCEYHDVTFGCNNREVAIQDLKLILSSSPWKSNRQTLFYFQGLESHPVQR